MIYVLFIFLLLFIFIYWTYSQEKLDVARPFPQKTGKNKFVTFDNRSSSKLNSKKISILSYNILCQKFMKRKNRKDLNLENRMAVIINEIKSLNSDVICIQETNWYTYKKFFYSIFNEMSFEYCDNYGSNFLNVIGYKREKFRKVSTRAIDISGINVEGSRGVVNLILQDIETGSHISIYNVHFPWRPKYDTQKCLIMNTIVHDVLSNKDIFNVIIAGDFNTIPNSLLMRLLYLPEFLRELEEDNIFPLIKNQISKEVFVNPIEPKFKLNRKSKSFSLKESVQSLLDTGNLEILKNFIKLKKTYNMKSAYADYNCNVLTRRSTKCHPFYDGHPDYTNYTDNFKETIDYIFHSQSLKLSRLLILPNKDELESEGFLPSSEFPSDHIKIFAEFNYKI